MLDVVAHIKIDETNKQRVKYFFASLRSCYEYKDFINLVINLENCSKYLYDKTKKELENSGCSYNLSKITSENYGKTYVELINNFCTYPYILNFIEDHFLTIKRNDFLSLLQTMQNYNVDISRSTFFEIEQKSSKNITDFIVNNQFGKIYQNNIVNYSNYCKPEFRYYIGVNFIVEKQFALKFWNRNLGQRPHPYEIPRYDNQFYHIIMIPNIEIQASIEDNHTYDLTQKPTCLLERNYNTDKFNEIWNKL